MMNLSSILDRNCERIPNRPAVVCAEDGRVFSQAEFRAEVCRLAGAFRDLGVGKGDRVALFLPNGPAYLAAYFAAVRLGAVATPFNILFRGPEIRYILNDSRARILVASRDEAAERLPGIRADLPHLEKVITVGGTWEDSLDFDRLGSYPGELAAVDCAPGDPVTILYTSGTTGHPKGAFLTHQNFLANAALNACPVLHINDQDLFFTGTPFCHIFFVLTVLGPLHAGAAVLTARRFTAPNALKYIADFKATHFAGVPTMYIYMLEEFKPEKYDLSAWRFAQSAGASMPAEYIRRIENTFDVGFCECYGATETSSTVTFGRLGHGKAGSVGPVAPGWAVIVADGRGNEVPRGQVGELWVKGQGLFSGYWEKPHDTEAAFRDGWFKTGDMGRVDEDGYYFLVDRKNDMIISGGYNVYPREVEDALYAHPAVFEVVVIGLPDPVLGEIPAAYVVLKPGAQADPDGIKAFCKEMLAPYKAPRRVEFVESLPKGPTGKILKRIVRDQILYPNRS
ncbi:MAG: AMP-binding protein [Peptococcaceae bacterium]|jgi:long-chain acyl-CoA synthetase|nr:AMP-binding protein [Peptococcaceae bacterium]